MRRENLGGMFADIGSCMQKAGLNRSRPRGGMEGDTEEELPWLEKGQKGSDACLLDTEEGRRVGTQDSREQTAFLYSRIHAREGGRWHVTRQVSQILTGGG